MTVIVVSETVQYGVSPPLSTAKPTEKDIAATKVLQESLEKLNIFDTDVEKQKRNNVLEKLNILVTEWIRKVSAINEMPEDQMDRVGGHLRAFGSYALGVHTRGADIDTVVIAPRHIQRSHFFGSFLTMLKSDENATEVNAVEAAFVPVIKLRYCNVEIDILFARLNLSEVPHDLVLDESLLEGMDEQSVRSLNAFRVAEDILSSVPDKTVFAIALRAIKVWAKNRSIYSNALGFLGGISYAIMVARTCQMYPNATASTIVEKFFLIFSNWKWPNPVVLKQITVNGTNNRSLDALVWNPRKRPQDKRHLMPIITPAYPEQNSTFNVTKSTFKVINNEISEGFELMNRIAGGTANWMQLFEEVNFFSRYRHFICLQATSATNDHIAFGGLVEAKIRRMVTLVERNPVVNVCHINSRKFKQLEHLAKVNENTATTLWFIGMEFNKGMAVNVDLTKEMQQFGNFILNEAVKTGDYNAEMLIQPFYVNRKELQNFVPKEALTQGQRHRNMKAEDQRRKRKATDDSGTTVKRARQ